MNAARIASVCALMACAIVGFPSTARPIAPPPIDMLPDGARQLCSARAVGTLMQIEWTSYATPQTPAQARDFYERMGMRFVATPGETFTWAPNAQVRLIVYPTNGSYPRCEQQPLATDQSVLVRARISP